MTPNEAIEKLTYRLDHDAIHQDERDAINLAIRALWGCEAAEKRLVVDSVAIFNASVGYVVRYDETGELLCSGEPTLIDALCALSKEVEG